MRLRAYIHYCEFDYFKYVFLDVEMTMIHAKPRVKFFWNQGPSAPCPCERCINISLKTIINFKNISIFKFILLIEQTEQHP